MESSRIVEGREGCATGAFTSAFGVIAGNPWTQRTPFPWSGNRRLCRTWTRKQARHARLGFDRSTSMHVGGKMAPSRGSGDAAVCVGRLVGWGKKRTSLRFASNSRYCRPFWMKDTRAPGGSSTPFATDVSVEKDSFPKTNAACVNPDSSIYRYTRKFTSSLETDISAETRTTPTITPPDT